MRPRIFTVAVAALFFATSTFAQVGNNDSVADANLASEAELAGIPGIDAPLARAIVAGRPYLTAKQLDNVLAETLDEDQRREVYGHVFRQINLNSASREEIMVVPGLSSRMAHEFEEYRPYTSLDQFRREIGKYVDDDEVARLEQYVFIR